MSVSMRIAFVAVGNLSPHDQGAGRAWGPPAREGAGAALHARHRPRGM
jgi:hypothetical protein